MLNTIWLIMIVGGFLYGTMTGNLHAVSDSVLSGAENAVNVCVTLLGVVSFWCGLMEIAERSGLVEWMSCRIWSFLHIIFPSLKKTDPAVPYISLNFISNILGLGWAATPAGLKAVELLHRSESGSREHADYNICAFLVINISSLQLIPVNVIAYRSQYGSRNPVEIVGPAIFATAVSTIIAVIFCRCMYYFEKK